MPRSASDKSIIEQYRARRRKRRLNVILILVVAAIAVGTMWVVGMIIKPGGNEVAVIQTSMGNIVIEFYPNEAPKTVENFKKLAGQNFYDGTKFHRVIPNFVIQGGDPNSKDDDKSNDGEGGPGYTIDDEVNWHSHIRGAVSMARTNEPNSAGSQFFIVLKPQTHLDANFTVFGNVIEGMDVADAIAQVQRDSKDNPLQPVVVYSIRIEPRSSLK